MDFYGAFLPREFQIATYLSAKESSTRTQKKSVSVYVIKYRIQSHIRKGFNNVHNIYCH